MKKLIVIFMLVACLFALQACTDEPVEMETGGESGNIEDTGNIEGTGTTEGTDPAEGTDSTEGTDPAEGTGSTEGADPTEPDTYEITYVNTDFLTNSNPESYKADDADITLVAVEKEGYVFGGWYSDEALTAVITVIDTAQAADITVYAKFTVEQYKIVFDADGGSVTAENITVSYGDELSASDLPTPTKEGFEFGGWFVKEEDVLTSQLGIDITTVGDLGEDGAELTVYAKWTRPTVAVTVEGGAGTDGAAKAEMLSSALVIETLPVNPAYCVEGYYTTDALEVKVANADGSLIANVSGYTDANGQWTRAEACTLYVKWTIGAYGFTSESNLYAFVGTDCQGMAETVTGDAEGYTSKFNMTTGSSIYGAQGSLTLHLDITDAEITALKNAGYRYIKLTMKQTAGSNLIFYTTADGTRAYNDNLEKTGTFDFVLSFLDGGEQVFYLPIDSATINLRIDRALGLAASTEYEYLLKDATPVTQAEVIAGLRLDVNPAGCEKTKTTSFVATTDVDWQGRNVDVKYDFNLKSDGTANVGLNLSLAPNCSADVLADLKTAGYETLTFDYYTDYVFLDGSLEITNTIHDRTTGAWTTFSLTIDELIGYTNGTRWRAIFDWSTYGSYITESRSFAIDNVTLSKTPLYVEYSITYNNVDGLTNSNPVKYTSGDADITLTAIAKEGYTFGGWYSDEALTTQVTVIDTAAEKNITLYAKLTKEQYKIVFNADGGTVTPGYMTVEYGAAIPTLPTPTFDAGYQFCGWYIKEEGVLTSKLGEDITAVGDLGDNGAELTVYAKWERPTYSITLENGDADGSAKVDAMSTYITIENAPTQLALSPEGYYTTDTLAVKVANTDGSLIANVDGYTDADGKWIKDEACTLYVKWTVGSYGLTSNSNLYAYVGGDYQGMKQTVTGDADGYTSSFTMTTGSSIYGANGTLTLTVDMTDDEKAALKAAGYNYLMFTIKQTAGNNMTLYTTADGTRAYDDNMSRTGTLDFVMSFLDGGERVFYFPIDSTTVKLMIDRALGLSASTTYEYMLKDVVPVTDEQFIAGLRLDNAAGADTSRLNSLSVTYNGEFADEYAQTLYAYDIKDNGYSMCNQLKLYILPNCSASMLSALKAAGYTSISFEYYMDMSITDGSWQSVTSNLGIYSKQWTTVTIAIDDLITMISTRAYWTAIPDSTTLVTDSYTAKGTYCIGNVSLTKDDE